MREHPIARCRVGCLEPCGIARHRSRRESPDVVTGVGCRLHLGRIDVIDKHRVAPRSQPCGGRRTDGAKPQDGGFFGCDAQVRVRLPEIVLDLEGHRFANRWALIGLFEGRTGHVDDGELHLDAEVRVQLPLHRTASLGLLNGDERHGVVRTTEPALLHQVLNKGVSFVAVVEHQDPIVSGDVGDEARDTVSEIIGFQRVILQLGLAHAPTQGVGAVKNVGMSRVAFPKDRSPVAARHQKGPQEGLGGGVHVATLHDVPAAQRAGRTKLINELPEGTHTIVDVVGARRFRDPLGDSTGEIAKLHAHARRWERTRSVLHRQKELGQQRSMGAGAVESCTYADPSAVVGDEVERAGQRRWHEQANLLVRQSPSQLTIEFHVVEVGVDSLRERRARPAPHAFHRAAELGTIRLQCSVQPRSKRSAGV